MFTEAGDIDWDRIAIIDTETLGLDPRVHPVWEVAIAFGERETQEYSWQVEVRDIDIDRADPYALQIAGFHDRYNLDETLTPRATAERLVGMLDGRHIIGAVPSFDEERLRQLVWKHLPGAKIPWHYHLIDVETLLIGWLVAQGHRPQLPWDSDELSELVGVTGADRHTALGDVRWARAQLVEMVRRSPATPLGRCGLSACHDPMCPDHGCGDEGCTPGGWARSPI